MPEVDDYKKIVNKVSELDSIVKSSDGHVTIEPRIQEIESLLKKDSISDEQRKETGAKLEKIRKENSKKFNGATGAWTPDR